MARKPRQSSLASQSRRAMSLPNDPRVRRGSQGFSDQFNFFIGPGLMKNEFGELQVDFEAVCAACGPGGGGGGACPPGFHRDPTSGQCVVDPIQCPAGQIWDPVLGQCVTPGPGECPTGTIWDPISGLCVAKPRPGSLSPGGCGCSGEQAAGFATTGGRTGCTDTLAWMGL